MKPLPLTSMPNIGSALAEELEQAGVRTPEDLRRLGAIKAAAQIAAGGRKDCSSMLCALEGAIRGVRWHRIPKDERTDLKRRFDREMQTARSTSQATRGRTPTTSR